MAKRTTVCAKLDQENIDWLDRLVEDLEAKSRSTMVNDIVTKAREADEKRRKKKSK